MDQLKSSLKMNLFCIIYFMRVLLILFGFLSFSGKTQFLDNFEGKSFGEVPFFNQKFVKQNKIKSIKGYYSTKADLDYIRKTKDSYTYLFNENGQLIQEYRTVYKDTIVTNYFYNEKGLISIKRKSDEGGFHSYHYTYDEKGRILTEEYRRDINRKRTQTNFELDRTFIVKTDRFSYLDYDSLNYKKTYYNQADKVFKEEFFYYNEFGYLAKSEGRLKMGSGLNKTELFYDAHGRVVTKTNKVVLNTEKLEKWTYEYDKFNNILAEHYYKNGVYTTEQQLVYYVESLLLKAIISRDEETNFLTILQFSDYKYFN